MPMNDPTDGHYSCNEQKNQFIPAEFIKSVARKYIVQYTSILAFWHWYDTRRPIST